MGILRILYTLIWIKVYTVSGSSMEPTLKEGDLILLRKPKEIQTGDVIVFKHQNNDLYIKRVSKIENNEYYVLGDNPTKSTDSRKFGFIKSSKVVGRMWRKI